MYDFQVSLRPHVASPLLLSDDRHYVAIMRNISYQSPSLKQSGMVNDEMIVSQDSSDQQTHII